MNIIPSTVCERLNYDPITGVITWKTSFFKTKVGKPAGQLRGDGYLQVEVGGTAYLSHRIAWFIHYGEQPPKEIDHINCVRTDNRLCNLRSATRNANQHNKRLQRNSTSGVKGVSWHKHTKQWVARIMINKNSITLGYFRSIEAAEEHIKDFRELLHDEYANHG